MTTVVRGAALAILVIGSLLIVVAGLVSGPAMNAALALASAVFPVGLVLLACSGLRHRGRLLLGLTGLGLMLVVATGAVLVLDATGPHRTILGLPPGTLVMFLGLGLGPLVVVVGLYAATFDRTFGRD